MNHNSNCLAASVTRWYGRVLSVLFVLLVGAMTARADWPNTNATKWVQYPDTNGLDVLMSQPLILADDFLCTNSAPITDIHLWTSWLNDQVQAGIPITLSIWSDVPKNPPQVPFSHPGTKLWEQTFLPGPSLGQYQYREWTNVLNEQFWTPDPPPQGQFLGFDHIIWQYNFYPTEPFEQEGTPEDPLVYWLAVTVPATGAQIGWKTSTNHWNDDAVCGHVDLGIPRGDWWELFDPREPTISLDLSFVLTAKAGTNDFGDAPDSLLVPGYPTLLANNGARHRVMPGLFLGTLIDAEWDGQPNPSATGDDAANLADEDGVVFVTPLVPGQNATINVFASQGQLPINAWVDFGADGSWLPPSDQIAINLLTVAPPNPTVINFLVPPTAVAGPTYARFRFSTQPNLAPTGPAPDGEVEDYQVVITQEQPTMDFGDAPDQPYPTLLASNGARHTIAPNVFLGALVDAENDGQPNIPATGDDLNPPAGADDEDGVTFAGNFVPGQPYTVTVTANVPGFLNAWVDFNGDGSWAQPGDQIFTDQPLGGPANLTFTVPATATWGNTNAYARFRFSTIKGLSYWGPAADGEVEDYRRDVEPLPQHDLGDAPCSLNNTPIPPGTPMTAYFGAVVANFPTALVFPGPAWPVGPIHMQPTNVAFLGPNVTFESNADLGPDQDLQNNILPATDTSNLDGADDGVLLPVTLPHCRQTSLNIVVTIPGPPAIPGPMYLNVWFDWNRNGDWNNTMSCPDGTLAPEWAVTNLVVSWPGPSLYPRIILVSTPLFTAWHPALGSGPLWMRITLAETNWPAGGFTGAGGDGPVNGYKYGETEDYLLDYEADEVFDWGDAPAGYGTLAAANGARHQLVPAFFLGPAIDTEADGQPDPLALGDDNNGVPDDEDGVTFTPLVRGSNAWATVALASGPAGAKLDAWVDFDGDGTWSTPAEQIFASQALLSGFNTLPFFVPTNAQLGRTFARFRLSSAGGLLPSGAAQDGEVEDYLVRIAQPRPATNVVITQITITNLTSPTAQAVTLYWNAETNISYQVQATLALTNTPPTWTNVSPLILGPLNSFTETNSVMGQRFYRIAVPFTYP